MRTVRVGSRDSVLAVRQAELVMEAIRAHDPEIRCELVTMKTTGDKILDVTLDKIGGKGLFTKELDIALAEGRVDITVHSAKDLPMELPEGLPLAAFSRRGDPRDALVLPSGCTELGRGAPIGSSSLRRTMHLTALYPDHALAPVRGNVQTRLRKLDGGEFSGLVLAAAGLERLGLTGRISRYFSPEEILPAACQAIIAVQARAGEDTSYLRAFDDETGRACALTERAFVRALDGGCTSPTAGYSEIHGGEIRLRGVYVDGSGRRAAGEISGPVSDGPALAETLAKRLREELQ